MLTSLALIGALTPDVHADDATLRFSGDLRYRDELSFVRPGGDDLRFRQRLRARVGAKGDLGDVTAGLRLRTGNPDDPNSPYVDLGSGFDSFDVNLDRAYLQWNPAGGDSYVVGGKFSRPNKNVGIYEDFVWDADIQPEGVGLSAAAVSSDTFGLTLNGGFYNTVENGGNVEDGYLADAQLAAALGLGDAGTLHVTPGILWLNNANPGDNTLLTADNRGNALDAGTDTDGDGVADTFGYAGDFLLLDAGLQADLSMVKIGGRFVMNLAADADNIGWQGGASVPFTVAEKKMAVWADVHSLQQESWFSPLVGDDHQVDYDFFGVTAGVKLKAMDRLGFHLWHMMELGTAQADAGEAMNQRTRLDVTASF